MFSQRLIGHVMVFPWVRWGKVGYSGKVWKDKDWVGKISAEGTTLPACVP